MADNPYRRLPDSAYWRRAVAPAGATIDPIDGPFLSLSRTDKVATAGSCFAQHIARHLAASGFAYLVTETAHPIIPAADAASAGYGLFTARYGNIYTTRQLVQLFDRAYSHFHPKEDVWEGPNGSVVDPFRPTIQPGGFASVAEMHADRIHHLAKVREAFETLDVFVFTLGLTEGWVSRRDGAAFPICPGVSGGVFDPEAHAFHNMRVGEVTADLHAFIDRLRSVNPAAKLILTVSPVPLAATASGNHVLPATIYSKSVLRAAAQEVAEDVADVFYFPSYEIITGPQSRGRFFSDTLRDVTEDGVRHVMSVFLRHAAGIEPAASIPADEAPADAHTAGVGEWVQVMCDEAMLDQIRDEAGPTPAPPADAQERWLLVNVCQVFGLQRSLAAQAPSIFVDGYELPEFMRLAKAGPERFRTYDRALIWPGLLKQEGFDPDWLPETRFLPSVEFTALHPDCCYAFVDDQPIAGLIGLYHSVLCLAAFKEGLSAEQASRFFTTEVFDQLGYFEQWQPRVARMIEEFAEYGLDIAAAAGRWTTGNFMHTLNHPKAYVLHDIAAVVLRREGIEPRDAPVPQDTLMTWTWPVYPEIGAARGIDGAYRFKPSERDHELNLTEFLDESLRGLARYHPSQVRVIPFVQRTLKGARALMRGGVLDQP